MDELYITYELKLIDDRGQNPPIQIINLAIWDDELTALRYANSHDGMKCLEVSLGEEVTLP